MFALETVVALALRLGVAMTVDIRAEAARRLFEAFIILIDDRIRRYKETVEGREKKGGQSARVWKVKGDYTVVWEQNERRNEK